MSEFAQRFPILGGAGRVWGILGLGAFGFAPLLFAFFGNLWKLPEYQFFPQALAAAGFLAWERFREVPQPIEPGRNGPLVAGVILSLAALGAAILVWSPLLGMLAFFGAMVTGLWWIGGWPLLSRMIPALIVALTIIPLPLGLDARLGLFLREVATDLSSRMLDLVGVIHCVDGNVIELPGQKLLVEEACSGINSVLFVTAFSLFFLLWRRRPFWYFTLCLPAALAFVVMGNVVRISLGAWLRYHDGIDILTGWKHELLSIVLVIIYVFLVISLEHLVSRGKRVPSIPLPPTPSPRAPLNPPGQVGWLWAIGGVLALMGAASAHKGWEKSKEGVEPLRAARASFESDLTFSMPETVGDWSRAQAGPPTVNKVETIGLSSMIWNFERPGMSAVVAFDYPIWRYHDVEGCYTNIGWVLDRKELIVPEVGGPPRIQMEMKKDPGARGSLWFATINEHGEWVDQSTLKRDFASRLGLLGLPDETTFRVQVLVVSSDPLDLASRAAAMELFDAAAAALAGQIKAEGKK
jgi:exosortase